MLTATVTAACSIHLYLKLIGTNGVEMDIPFVLDTGFSEYLSLPKDFLDALGFPEVSTDTITLADGSQIEVSLHNGVVVWDGQTQGVTIHCLGGDALVGISQMMEYTLNLPVRVNSIVTLTPIP